MNKNKNDIANFLNQSDQIEDDFIDMEDELFCDEHDDAMTTMFPVIMDSTIEITRLVIENKIRNSEKMSDKDIHQIHEAAFQHISNIFATK